jgi:hypothetical protein
MAINGSQGISINHPVAARLGMAESKSNWFGRRISSHSEKAVQLDPSLISILHRFSERISFSVRSVLLTFRALTA